MNNVVASHPASFTDDQIERRARSVSINAVRELRVAYGRDAGPWTDDDVRRSNAIFELLHLDRLEDINPAVESFPIVSPVQTENKVLDALEKHIAKLSALPSNIIEEEEAPSALRIPKAPVARVK